MGGSIVLYIKPTGFDIKGQKMTTRINDISLTSNAFTYLDLVNLQNLLGSLSLESSIKGNHIRAKIAADLATKFRMRLAEMEA